MPLSTSVRRAARAAVVAGGVLLAGACSSGDDSSAPTTAVTATETGTSETPKPSALSAVEAFLTAEKSGDHAGSYRLLTTAARKELSLANWSRQRSEVPPVTGYTVEGTDGPSVVAIVEHEPGLDPFIGLSPARERQTWRAREEGPGWLVEPGPLVEPLHPPADQAVPAALAWARAVQACDEAAARSHQGIDRLFGTSDAPALLCRTQTALAAGRPERLAAGPSSQELVAQYGAEVLEWARTVGVTGGERPFHVVLAPIGSVWRVVGVFEP